MLSDDEKPYAHILTAAAVDGIDGLKRAIHHRDSNELRLMAAELVVRNIQLPYLLEAWGLPQLERPHFWFDGVLPQIQYELQQRDKKLSAWASSQTLPGGIEL